MPWLELGLMVFVVWLAFGLIIYMVCLHESWKSKEGAREHSNEEKPRAEVVDSSSLVAGFLFAIVLGPLAFVLLFFDSFSNSPPPQPPPEANADG